MFISTVYTIQIRLNPEICHYSNYFYHFLLTTFNSLSSIILILILQSCHPYFKMSTNTLHNKPSNSNIQNQNDLLLLKNRFLEFKIDIDEDQVIENDNQFSSSSYAYDFDGIKIQFLYDNH